MANQLGKTIRILRQAKSLTLTKVAKDSGISIPYLSLLESGERQPSLDVVRRLAGTLEIPSDVLFVLGMESGSLKSSERRTSDLAETVGRMLELEDKLNKLLDKETSRASKCNSSRAHRRSNGDKRR